MSASERWRFVHISGLCPPDVKQILTYCRVLLVFILQYLEAELGKGTVELMETIKRTRASDPLHPLLARVDVPSIPF